MRIQLIGHGDPNPEFALPDPGTDSSMPPRILQLSDGVPFEKAPHMADGYTHYECWCIGGAGGRGSDVYENMPIPMTPGPAEVAPIDVWNDYWTHALDAPDGHYWIPDGSGGYAETTKQGYYEYGNPTHTFTPTIYGQAYLAGRRIWGGAGGGGGLQVVSGALAFLEDAVPVTVGQAGADGAGGQMAANGSYTPQPGGGYPWSGLFQTWFNRWPTPHLSFPSPTFGGDGGSSSFGTHGMASGGKGGGPGGLWLSSNFYTKAEGGAGGIGGQTTAGGGAAGGKTSDNAPDGTWDGTIGKGGGGGQGGMMSGTGSGFHPIGDGVVFYGPNQFREASNGGRGSYSFSDTSVYGERELRTTPPPPEGKDPYNNYLELVPGGGGGAKANHLLPFGSHNTDPNGAVLLRLLRIET
jgi:hypothetical protein